MASRSLWNYYRNEINDDPNENVNNRINNNKIITRRPFEYQTKLIWSTPNDNNTFNAEVVVQLIYLNNFGDLLIYHLLTVKQNLIYYGEKNV